MYDLTTLLMVLPLFGMGILTYTGIYAHVCTLMRINTALIHCLACQAL